MLVAHTVMPLTDDVNQGLGSRPRCNGLPRRPLDLREGCAREDQIGARYGAWSPNSCAVSRGVKVLRMVVMPALADLKEQGSDRQSARVGLKVSQPIQAPYLRPPVFRPLLFISPLLI